MNDINLLKEFISEMILDEAKKKKKAAAKKRAAKKGKKKSSRSKKKRPGNPNYYKGINKKGQKAMEKEINKCSAKGKPKGWKMPKSCYDSEWEADKDKYKKDKK